jgi:hypothetical protein
MSLFALLKIRSHSHKVAGQATWSAGNVERRQRGVQATRMGILNKDYTRRKLYYIWQDLYYCSGIDVMPNGWPLQRMRSMRKEEAETRSRGRIFAVKK